MVDVVDSSLRADSAAQPAEVDLLCLALHQIKTPTPADCVALV